MPNAIIRSKSALLLLLLFLLGGLGAAHATTTDQLRPAIETILARPAVANNTWSIYLENEERTTSYFTRQATTVMRPASVTKVFTTAASFALLGPEHRFETRIYGTGNLAGGTLTGDLHIVPEHDFTWSTRFYNNARTPLNNIASALFNQGLRQVAGDVVCGGRGAFNDSGSNAIVAAEFRQALIDRGIVVLGQSTTRSGFGPVGTLLHTHRSITLGQAAIPLNRNSVNLYADFLLRHLGYRLSGSETYTAGSALVRDWLESIGIDTTGFRMADGSGLQWSTTNDTQISALQSLEVHRHMRLHFPSFESTLTVGGVSGTLASRFTETAARGRVFGKTGTLPNGQTVSLSGYVKNQHDGQVYYFALIANQASDVTASRNAIDDVVRLLLSANLRNDGPLPPDVIVIDNADPAYSTTGSWETGALMGGHRFDYRFAHVSTATAPSNAIFRPDLPQAGRYDVYVWYLDGGNRHSAVRHFIHHAEGVTTVPVDQTINGGRWLRIGENIRFASGNDGFVRVDSFGSGGVAMADAVRWELVAPEPEPVPQPPLLHYPFNEKDGPAMDVGSSPAAAGELVGAAARADETPSGFGRALDTTAARGHISAGAPGKLSGLERFTLTAWVNLRAAPAHTHRIMSKQAGGTWDGFSFGLSNPNTGAISPGNVTLDLSVGGTSGIATQRATEDVGADQVWVFVAAVFDSALPADNTAFFIGSAAEPVRLLGARRHLATGPARPTTAPFRVASTAAIGASTTPHAWFDDVRVYDHALSRNQLESVRLENLEPRPPSLTEWQRENFTVAQLADAEVGGLGADPLGESIPNLLRYALGLDPWTSARTLLPPPELHTQEDGRYLQITIMRPENIDDISYVVEGSADLEEWQSSTRLVSYDRDGYGSITETYRDDTPIDETSRRFLRLRAALKPN